MSMKLDEDEFAELAFMRGRLNCWNRDVVSVVKPLLATTCVLCVLVPTLFDPLFDFNVSRSFVFAVGISMLSVYVLSKMFRMQQCAKPLPLLDKISVRGGKNRVVIGHRGAVAVAVPKQWKHSSEHKSDDGIEDSTLKSKTEEKSKKSLVDSTSDISSAVGGLPSAHMEFIPENSLQAFDYAALHNCDGVEFDVRFTKDGHPVVFHDFHIRKLTDFLAIVCRLLCAEGNEPRAKAQRALGRKLQATRGEIHELTLAQLKAFSWDVSVCADMFESMTDETQDSSKSHEDEKRDLSDETFEESELLPPVFDAHKRIASFDELCAWTSRTLRKAPEFVLFTELKHLPNMFLHSHIAAIIDTLMQYPSIKLDRNVVILSFSTRIMFTSKLYMSNVHIDNDSPHLSLSYDTPLEAPLHLSLMDEPPMDAPLTLAHVIHTGLIYERHAYYEYCFRDTNKLHFHWFIRAFHVYLFFDPIYASLKRWLLPQFLGVSLMGYPSWLASEFLANYYKRSHNIGLFVWGGNHPTDVAYLARHSIACVVDDPKLHCKLCAEGKPH